MNRSDVVSGAVLGLVALVTLLVVIPAQIEPAPPGFVSPRLVPQLMMIAVAGLSVLMVINGLRGGAGERAGPVISRGELLALGKIGAVFAVALALYLWGSPLGAGVALILGALVALGERRPLILVLMPVLLLASVWFLFYRVLGTAIV